MLRKKLRPGDNDVTDDNIRIDTFEDEQFQEKKLEKPPVVTYGCLFMLLAVLVIIIIVSTVALVPNFTTMNN